jgi:hypothetical protein
LADALRESGALDRREDVVWHSPLPHWSAPFYQYANRLAYQFWLLQLNKIPSGLVFLNFVNAKDMNGPKAKDEWFGAIRLIHSVLGVPERLDRFGVYHAFLDAGDLRPCRGR